MQFGEKQDVRERKFLLVKKLDIAWRRRKVISRSAEGELMHLFLQNHHTPDLLDPVQLATCMPLANPPLIVYNLEQTEIWA